MATDKCLSLQDLRVVLLGGKQSGRTSLINTILGLDGTASGKRSAHSIKTEGEVRGRKVVLVDTHGWWRHLQVIDTAEFMKIELVLSLCLCPPGPHVFLLAVMIDIPFDEQNRRAVEQHMGLFGENIWGHTIVVFTRGESLKGKSIEQHSESEGEALKWLLEKCGNRYWVYDKQDTDQSQVSQLLEKIEGVVDSNSGRHFELDEKTLKEAEEKRRAVKERAHARFTRMMKHREKFKQEAQDQSLPEIRSLLLGWVTSRKTSAKNTILNQKEHVTKKTTSAQTQTGEVSGLKVSVVDTPGWWKYFPAQFTPGWVKKELQRSLSLSSGRPHAILLAIPADTTFLEEQRKITEDNMRMFGEQVWRYTIVLFTCGDQLGNTSIEEHIESEGEPLQWLVEKCGNRYHVLDNINRGDGSQVTELLEKIKEMVAGNEPIEMGQITVEPEGVDTEIGKLLDKEWTRMDEEMEKKIKELTWEMKEKHSLDISVNFKSDRSALGESTYKSEMTGQTSEIHAALPEKVQKTFEREFGRRETVVTERFRAMLLERISDDTSEPDEHEYQQSIEKVVWWFRENSEMRENLARELGRQELVDIERAWGYFKMNVSHGMTSESDACGHDQLCRREMRSSGIGSESAGEDSLPKGYLKDMTSEPDQHDYDQPRKKVCRWRAGTSGLGSELEDEDTEDTNVQ